MTKYQTLKKYLKATIHETISALRFLYNEINPPKYQTHTCRKCGKTISKQYDLCYNCFTKENPKHD